MTRHPSNENLETKIIRTAQQLFLEKGFVETSMSDIAATVGINRPTLHYYFRTKDKMFRAVFRNIVSAIIPEVQDIVLQQESPIQERISKVTDAYFRIFTAQPSLPFFLMREMQRDANLLLATISELAQELHLKKIVRSLQKEMESGKLKAVPLPFVFYTFYSLLTFPFLSKPVSAQLILQKGESFDQLLKQWKPYILMHMTNLLSAEKTGGHGMPLRYDRQTDGSQRDRQE